MSHSPSRRDFLAATVPLLCSAGLASHLLGADIPRSQPQPRRDPPTRKLAVVTTAYFYLSHAYNVCGRFLYGSLRDGKMHYPDFGIAGQRVIGAVGRSCGWGIS